MIDQFLLFQPDTPPEIFSPGDIVSYNYKQHMVEEVRVNSQMRLDNGEVIWPWECLRIAKQSSFFVDMGLPERNQESTVQLLML